MVRRASFAMAVKLLLKDSSRDAIEAAWSWRIMSRSAFSFSLRRVGLPVFMENSPIEAPAFAGLEVLGGQVGLADAGQVEARIGEGVDHVCAVCDQADADLVKDPRIQLVPAMGTDRGLDGVANLLGALKLHRIGPAVALVHQVPWAVISVLVARVRAASVGR